MSCLSTRVTVRREIALPPSLKGVLLFIVFSQVHEDLFRSTGRVCVHVSVCECVYVCVSDCIVCTRVHVCGGQRLTLVSFLRFHTPYLSTYLFIGDKISLVALSLLI